MFEYLYYFLFRCNSPRNLLIKNSPLPPPPLPAATPPLPKLIWSKTLITQQHHRSHRRTWYQSHPWVISHRYYTHLSTWAVQAGQVQESLQVLSQLVAVHLSTTNQSIVLGNGVWLHGSGVKTPQQKVLLCSSLIKPKDKEKGPGAWPWLNLDPH